MEDNHDKGRKMRSYLKGSTRSYLKGGLIASASILVLAGGFLAINGPSFD